MQRWTRIGDFALTDDRFESKTLCGSTAWATLGVIHEHAIEAHDLRRFLWELCYFDVDRMTHHQVLATLDDCVRTGVVSIVPWERVLETLFSPGSSGGGTAQDANASANASASSRGSVRAPAASSKAPQKANPAPPPPSRDAKVDIDGSPRQPKQEITVTDIPRAPSLSALHAELAQIGARLRTDGFTPQPDEELRAAIARGDYDDVRFVVSLQKNKASLDEPVGYRRPDTGRTTMWTAPYDAMKAGDLSAPLLCALNGTEYDPKAKYQLFLLDKGPNYKVDGSVSLVPTFEKLAAVGSAELSMDDPTDPTRDPRVLEAVMTSQMQETYRKSMEAFWAEAKTSGGSEYRSRDIAEFAAEYFETPEEQIRFKARHLYRTQIGANAFFRGDGATEFVPSPNNVAAIAADGIAINSAPGKLGMPELLTIEKNPPTIRELQNQGSLLAIAL